MLRLDKPGPGGSLITDQSIIISTRQITEENIIILHVMGNKTSLPDIPEEGKEIFREYETFLSGRKRISTSVSLQFRIFSRGKFFFLAGVHRQSEKESTESSEVQFSGGTEDQRTFLWKITH